jgi:segregation and condensation protein B
VNADDAAARSLAEQAATWVPPWARQPVDPKPEPEPEPEPESEPVAESEVEAAGESDVAPEPEPAVASALESTLGLVEILEAKAPNLVSNLPRSEDSSGGEPDAAEQAELAEQAEQAEPARVEIEPAELRGALEAILLVVDEPVSEIILAQVLDVTTDRIREALDELAADYSDNRRGFDLRQAAGGWRFYTRADFSRYVERFVLDGQQVRLTQAALETLAVIAYKQPVTRSRISAIRGVNCDGVVRTLLARGLIEECGSEPDSGAFLYRTTMLFLEKLGLNSVDELPPLAPFLPDDVDEIANAEN